MRHRILALMILLTLTCAFAAGAQAPQPTASQIAAVKELFQVMDLAKTTNEAVEVMYQAQVQANPALKQFEDVTRPFMAKYLSWTYLEPQMIQVYAEAYTEPELRELIAFYRTPIGKKTVVMMPKLMQKGAALGQKAVQDHLPELQAAIEKKMKESGSKQP